MVLILLDSKNLDDYDRDVSISIPKEGDELCLFYGTDLKNNLITGLGIIDGRGSHGKVNTPWRDEIFLENLFTQQGYPRMEAVRTDNWKYIRCFPKEHDRNKYLPLASIQGEIPIYEELFYLKEDPIEQQNLISNKQYSQKLNQLRNKCQTLVTALEK